MIRKFLLVSGACGLLVAGCGSFDGNSKNHGNDVKPTNQLGEQSKEEGKGQATETQKPEQTTTTEQSGKPDKPEVVADDTIQGGQVEETVTKPEKPEEVVKPEEQEVQKPEEVVKPEEQVGQIEEPTQDEPFQGEPTQQTQQEEMSQEETFQGEHTQQGEVSKGEHGQSELSQDGIHGGAQESAIDPGILDRVEVMDSHYAEIDGVFEDGDFASLKTLIMERIDAMDQLAQGILSAEDLSKFSTTLSELKSKLDGLESESLDVQKEGAAKVIAAVEQIEIFLSERQ